MLDLIVCFASPFRALLQGRGRNARLSALLSVVMLGVLENTIWAEKNTAYVLTFNINLF